MTLRKKTLIIVGVTMASLILILYAVSRIILLGSFAELEEQHTHQDVERALSALFDDLAALDTMVRDWATWDDTYAFIEDANEDYIRSNLVDSTFTNIRLNLMLFSDSSGQIVVGKGFDLHNEEEAPLPPSLQEHLAKDAPLLHHPDIESNVAGIVLLPEGPLLIASRPILTSERQGPIRGTLMMGRYLDSTEIERLAEITYLSLTVHRLDDPQVPPDFQAARSALSEEAPIVIRALSAESVAGYALLQDIYGKPALVLRVDLPREIYRQGQASVSYFVLSLLVIGLAFGAVTLLLLERQVLTRLTRLSKDVSGIGTSGDISARVPMTGRDELSSLADAINGMLAALEQSQAELQVRNVELDAFAHTVAHDLKSPLTVLTGWGSLLEQGHAQMSDEQVSHYLHLVAQNGRKMCNIIDELLLLSVLRKIEEMELGPLDTTSVVAEAQGRLASLIEEYQPEIALPDTWPAATGYGPWVEEVWVNYLSNAIKYGGQPPRVELGATEQADGMVRFWVRDNGPGLTPEEQARLFTPFTRLDQVRAKGYGLGLSIVRRIVEKLDGQAGVESQVGAGSTFWFTLPADSHCPHPLYISTCSER